MPVELRRNFKLSELGNPPPEIGEEIIFGEGRSGRVVSIENGIVKVSYNGTLHEKNMQDIEFLNAKEAAEAEELRKKFKDATKDVIYLRG